MSGANRLGRGLLVAAVLCGTCLGCASPVHYIQKYPDGGVIAMPRDTPEYLAKAERMMHEHLPQGYVTEPLQVVPVGEPYRTVANVGFFREARWRQDHQVLLTYHAALPLREGPGRMMAPPPPPVGAGTTPGPAPTQFAPPPGLPPEPVPIGN